MSLGFGSHTLRAPVRISRVKRGIICTLVGGTLWGVNGTVAQYLMAHYDIDPLWLVCVRELTCCWMFLAAAALLSRPQLKALSFSAKSLLHVGAVAMGAILSSQICYLEAIHFTNSATATVLQALSMALVLVWVCLMAWRRPRKRELAGLLCALLGTFLLVTGGDPTKLQLPFEGVMWGLGCALSAAALSILPKRAMECFGNFAVNGYAFLFSGILLALWYQPWNHMPALDGVGWGILAGVCVLGTFAAYGLYMQGVADAGSMRASLLGTIEPVMSTISTVLIMSAQFSIIDYGGFGLILAMVVLTTSGKNMPEEMEQAD